VSRSNTFGSPGCAGVAEGNGVEVAGVGELGGGVVGVGGCGDGDAVAGGGFAPVNEKSSR